jgi:hypothetical protein
MITLKTLPSATAQEVYDQVKAHLLAQKCKSENEEKCLYRGPDGTKCAAGILIGDDEYEERMDTCEGLGDTSWLGLVEEGAVPNIHRNLIVSLQQVHDSHRGEDFVEYITEKLEEVAVEYELVP